MGVGPGVGVAVGVEVGVAGGACDGTAVKLGEARPIPGEADPSDDEAGPLRARGSCHRSAVANTTPRTPRTARGMSGVLVTWRELQACADYTVSDRKDANDGRRPNGVQAVRRRLRTDTTARTGQDATAMAATSPIAVTGGLLPGSGCAGLLGPIEDVAAVDADGAEAEGTGLGLGLAAAL